MNARWIRLGPLEPHDFEQMSSHLASVQSERAAPALLWARAETEYLFALVAPRKLAPGRVTRWLSWALAPAVATYRQFGLAAYLEEDAMWLHGRRIAGSTVRTIGECAFVASSFLLHFPPRGMAMPSRELEDAFRLRLEAQHGWQFDHSWPTLTEKPAFAAAP